MSRRLSRRSSGKSAKDRLFAQRSSGNFGSSSRLRSLMNRQQSFSFAAPASQSKGGGDDLTRLVFNEENAEMISDAATFEMRLRWKLDDVVVVRGEHSTQLALDFVNLPMCVDIIARLVHVLVNIAAAVDLRALTLINCRLDVRAARMLLQLPDSCDYLDISDNESLLLAVSAGTGSSSGGAAPPTPNSLFSSLRVFFYGMMARLRVLKIARTNFTSASFIVFCEALATNTSLAYLDLSECNIEEPMLQYLSGALERHPSISRVNLKKISALSSRRGKKNPFMDSLGRNLELLSLEIDGLSKPVETITLQNRANKFSDTEWNLGGRGWAWIPEAVFRQTNLTHLILSKNRLRAIPLSICKLRALAVLDISTNEIQLAPLHVFSLQRLQTLRVASNPFVDGIPDEVDVENLLELSTWAKAYAKEEVPRIGIKVCIVGATGAGKTSVITAMRTAKGSHLGKKKGKTGAAVRSAGIQISDIEPFCFWDFNGQEALFSSQQLFFTSQALFCIVVDLSLKETHTHIDRWLEAIESKFQSEKIRVVIIGTHVDKISEATASVMLKKIEERLAGHVAAIFSWNTSLKNVSVALKDLLLKVANERIAVTVPRAFKVLQSSIVEEAHSLSCPVIDSMDFHRYVDLFQLDYDDVVASLRDVDGARFFNPATHGFICLDPSWLSAVVTKLVTDFFTIGANGGIFSMDHLSQIWHPSLFPISSHRRILEILVQLELIFLEKERYIVPCLLNHNAPPNFSVHMDPTYIRNYLFEYLPPDFMNHLLVRLMSVTNEIHCVWKAGMSAVLNTRGFRHLISAEMNQFDGLPRLCIQVDTLETTGRFLFLICNSVDTLLEDRYDVKVTRHIATHPYELGEDVRLCSSSDLSKMAPDLAMDHALQIKEDELSNLSKLGLAQFSALFKEQPVIIKRLVNRDQKYSFMKQIWSISWINHRCHVPVFGIILVPKLSAVFRSMTHETLRSFLDIHQPLPSRIRSKLTQDISLGLGVLHQQSPVVVHGKLTSRCIFVDVDSDGCLCAKIGFSPGLDQNTLWQAPEPVKQVQPSGDVYSLGIIMWELATGRFPFDLQLAKYGGFIFRLRSEIESDGTRPDVKGLDEFVDQTYLDLMKACWNQDPLARPNYLYVAAHLQQSKSVGAFDSTLLFDCVGGLGLTNDERKVLIGKDKEVKVVDVYSGTCVGTLSTPLLRGKHRIIATRLGSWISAQSSATFYTCEVEGSALKSPVPVVVDKLVAISGMLSTDSTVFMWGPDELNPMKTLIIRYDAVTGERLGSLACVKGKLTRTGCSVPNAEGDGHVLWIGRDGAVMMIDGITGKRFRRKLETSFVNCIYIPHVDQVWIFQRGGSISVFQASSGNPTRSLTASFSLSVSLSLAANDIICCSATCIQVFNVRSFKVTQKSAVSAATDQRAAARKGSKRERKATVDDLRLSSSGDEWYASSISLSSGSFLVAYPRKGVSRWSRYDLVDSMELKKRETPREKTEFEVLQEKKSEMLANRVEVRRKMTIISRPDSLRATFDAPKDDTNG